MITKISNPNKNNNEMYLFIRLTDRCNFDCSYCRLHSKNGFEFQKELIVNTISAVLKSIPNNKYSKIIYHIYGGEPTYHLEFLSILEAITIMTRESEFLFRIEVKTNLKKSVNFFHEVLSIHPNIKLGCSYQNHQQRKNNPEAKLIEYKNKLLDLQQAIINVDVMLEDTKYNSNIDEIKDLTYFLNANDIPFQLNPIDGIVPKEFDSLFNEFKKEDDQMIITRGNSIESISIGELEVKNINYFGMKCDAGETQFVLDFAHNPAIITTCYTDSVHKTNFIWSSNQSIEEIPKAIEISNRQSRCIHTKCICGVDLNKEGKLR